MKKLLCVIFTMMSSMVLAQCFDKDTPLVEALKSKNLRIITLYNFESLNNTLDIVTASHSPGYSLTNQGLVNLKNDFPLLETQGISYIYTSGAYRTLQTTNLIGAALNLAPDALIPDSRLSMQSFGDYEGFNYNVYKESFGTETQMLEGTPPNGDSGCAVYARIDSFLNSLTAYENVTILIVTHAFNYCYISKILTGSFGGVPNPGAFHIYDYSTP